MRNLCNRALAAAGALTLLAGLGVLTGPDRTVSDVFYQSPRVTSLGDGIRLKGKQEGFEVLTMDGIL